MESCSLDNSYAKQTGGTILRNYLVSKAGYEIVSLNGSNFGLVASLDHVTRVERLQRLLAPFQVKDAVT